MFYSTCAHRIEQYLDLKIYHSDIGKIAYYATLEMALVRGPLAPPPSHSGNPSSSNTPQSIANHRNSFLNLRSTYDIHGDTYIFAASNLNLLRTTNAELIAQFTARKNDFVKPVKNYRVMDVFGRNILTTEGEEWRRHKRIVGKSFGERSMGLVWEESLRQAKGMVGVWGRRMRKIRNEGERKSLEDEELRVDDAGSDTAILSLHVICAAGFGVPQLWEGQENEEVGKGTGREEGNRAPDLGLNRPIGNHTLGFKDCLNFVLSGLLVSDTQPEGIGIGELIII